MGFSIFFESFDVFSLLGISGLILKEIKTVKRSFKI